MWLSGAGDDQTDKILQGSFRRWRGGNTHYARVWGDSDQANQVSQWMMDPYWTAKWPGVLDVACGGLVAGQTWLDASTGVYDGNWTATLGKIRDRSEHLAQVHVSPFHELNGTWYPWSVTAATKTQFKTAFGRWSNLARSIIPAARLRIVLTLNSTNLCGVSVPALLPTLAQFDVLGVDCYNFDNITTQAGWDAWAHTVDSDGSPRGFRAWADCAASIGKPVTFPEWGINPQQPTDQPWWVEQMHRSFRSIAPIDPLNPKPGQLAGEAYFNAGPNTRLMPTTTAPLTAEKYRSLLWI